MNRAEYLQSSGWPHNSNNELLSTPLSSSGATGGSSYVYDANGNTIQKNDNGQIQNYVYDVDNRLIEVKDASNNTIAKYTYDPFGRRVKKELGSASPANAGGIVYYLYSDEGLIGEYDAAGNEIKTYGYKPNSTWSTDPLFMRESGNIYFYHNDHLGTPQKLTNISGAVVWSATYDAFGKAAIDASSTVTSNLRFPGQYFDAETGLHYNWHRYYDPTTGRYVTEDPIGYMGGLNLYVYLDNNSINKMDSEGLAFEPLLEEIDRQNCVQKCIIDKDCGGVAGKCWAKEIAPYSIPICSVVCLFLRNVPLCGTVCIIINIYGMYKCTMDELECTQKCEKECEKKRECRENK